MSLAVPKISARTRRILIVEDIEDTAASFANLLIAMGHAATYTTDSHEALDLARRYKPNLAFFDLGMPRPDGYELCAMFRADPEFKHLCIVAITAYGTPNDRARTRLVGFDAHVQKPVDIHVLESILDQFSKDAG